LDLDLRKNIFCQVQRLAETPTVRGMKKGQSEKNVIWL
jgi:hypothetical protein